MRTSALEKCGSLFRSLLENAVKDFVHLMEPVAVHLSPCPMVGDSSTADWRRDFRTQAFASA